MTEIDLPNATVCFMCEHGYGLHWRSHDKRWTGCTSCECDEFGWVPESDIDPAEMEIYQRVRAKLIGRG